MKKLVLTESQLKSKIEKIYKEEQYKILEEKWNKLSGTEKQFVLEFLKAIHPKKAPLIREAWYNTLGDIAGIFDPTGIIDIVNGLSYWNQGDKFFALLSWISVLPVLGDIIAKPVIGAMKIGGRGAKAFKAAVVAGDAAKIASTATHAGGPFVKLVEKAPTWGGKLIEALKAAIGRVPGIGRPIVRALEEFVSIFKTASAEIKLPSQVMKGGKLVSVEKALTSLEKEELLKQMAKEQGKLFSGYKDLKNNWFGYMKSDATLGQKLAAGAPRMFGNPATRSLMRRTKWYTGLLDFLGFGNFVGPEELSAQVDNLDEKMKEYSQTPEAQKAIQQDFGGMQPPQPEQTVTSQPPSPPKPSSDQDPFSFFNNMITAEKVVGALI